MMQEVCSIAVRPYDGVLAGLRWADCGGLSPWGPGVVRH
jgi:hypothetical protein